jgi:hypothetical protein
MPGTNALSSSDVKHRTIQLLLLLAIYVFPSSSSSFLSIGRLPVFLPFIFLRSLTIPPFLIFLRRSIRRLRCLLFQLYFLFSTLFLMVCCQLFMIPFGSLILYLFIFSHFSFCYLFSFPPPFSNLLSCEYFFPCISANFTLLCVSFYSFRTILSFFSFFLIICAAK